jgi:hypothetical protein
VNFVARAGGGAHRGNDLGVQSLTSVLKDDLATDYGCRGLELE